MSRESEWITLIYNILIMVGSNAADTSNVVVLASPEYMTCYKGISRLERQSYCVAVLSYTRCLLEVARATGTAGHWRKHSGNPRLSQ